MHLLLQNLLSLLDPKMLGEYRDNVWLRREVRLLHTYTHVLDVSCVYLPVFSI